MPVQVTWNGVQIASVMMTTDATGSVDRNTVAQTPALPNPGAVGTAVVTVEGVAAPASPG